MKKIVKILIFTILVMCIATIFSNVKAAGSFSVSAGTSMKKGQTGTLTITATNATGKFTITSSNSGVVSVSSSSVFVDGSEKVTLTANAVGTATITITPNGVFANDDFQAVTGAKTVTITVSDNTTTTTTTTTTTQSSDATLKSITIGSKTYSGSTLKDTISYTADATVSSIKISATKNNSKATVSGTGTKSLVAGQTNKFQIVVTAENGTKKTYTVNIIRLAEESNVPNVIDESMQNPEEVKLMLTSLVIKDVDLNPEFNSEVYNYTVNVQNIKELEIDATASKPEAQISIEGAEDLKEGDNIVKITVVLGEETVEYIINVHNSIEEEIIGAIDDNNNDFNNTKKIIIIAMNCLLGLIAIRYMSLSYKLSKKDENKELEDEEYNMFSSIKNQNIAIETGKFGKHY